MVSETRYFKNANINNNGLSCDELGTSQTASATYKQHINVNTASGTLGIRVWKRSSAGVETEITSGTPVAQLAKNMGTSGIESATWDCPQTDLAEGDSIVVRVYIYTKKNGTWGWWGAWPWQTEDLGPTTLSAATWTVYYSWYFFYSGNYYYRFRYGDSSVNSRIENFSYSSATYVNVTDSGIGSDIVFIENMVSDSGAGSELVEVAATVAALDTGLGLDAVTIEPATIEELGIGIDIAYRVLGEVSIDGTPLPHVMRIHVGEPTLIDSRPVPDALPTRKYQGGKGRLVELEGWTDSLSEFNSLKSWADGKPRTLILPTGDGISIRVTDVCPRKAAADFETYPYTMTATERVD